MKKFVVLYYSPPEAMAKMKTSSPEDMAKGQAAWMEWFKKTGDHLVEMGEFFTQGTRITKSGSEDSSGKVTGYSIIQADSLDAAKGLLENHPHLEWHDGCSLEVYEPMEMGK